MTLEQWVAVAAIWGALTGSAALVIEANRFWADRPKISFHVSNVDKGDGEYLRIEIINTGRRLVVIREIGLTSNRPDQMWFRLLTMIDEPLEEQGRITHDEEWHPFAVGAYESYGPSIRLKKVYALTHSGKRYSAKLSAHHQTFGGRIPPPPEWHYPSPPDDTVAAARASAASTRSAASTPSAPSDEVAPTPTD